MSIRPLTSMDLFQQAKLLSLQAYKTAVFSDFDGTIVPIVSSPEQIKIAKGTITCLSKIADKYAMLGFVSGRQTKQLKEMIGIKNAVYVGNHGMEILAGSKMEKLITKVEEKKIKNCTEQLKEKKLLKEEGVLIEDKQLSVSIHYRKRPELQSDILSLVKEVAGQLDLPFILGRKVVEVRPNLSINKGSTIVRLLNKHKDIKNVIYLGDDTTDIFAFKSLKKWAEANGRSCLNIGVESNETSLKLEKSIDFFATNVNEAIDFLKSLAA